MRLSDEMAKHWFSLPLPLRKRWWDETEFGKKPPSDDLKKAVEEFIAHRERSTSG
jgi:hypothetical protein